MTFPQTPRGIAVEMYIDAVWTDITSDVYQRDPITLTRGKTEHGSRTPPSSIQLMLNNRLGKYSPRNPLGTYYGKIGRNTPLRVRLNDLAAPVFDASSSPTAGTGNLSWTHTPATPNANPTGVLIWVVHTGTTTNQVTSVTYGGVTIPLHGTGDAASSPTGGTYTRHFLGTGLPRGPQTVVVTVSGAATKQAVCMTVTSTSAVEINNTPANTTGTGANPTKSVTVTKNTLILGLLHSGQDAITSVAPGTGYVDVVEHDFGSDVMSVIKRSTTAAAGAHNVLWTATLDTYLINDVALSDSGIRGSGEISSLPARWDTSGNDAWVPIEASGILRRTNLGSTPVSSGLKDYLVTTSPFAYWPLDEGPSATYGSQAGTGRPHLFYEWPPNGTVGSPVIAFSTGDLGAFLPKSLGIAHTGIEDVGSMTGGLVTSQDLSTLAVDFVFKSADLNAGFIRVHMTDDSYWIVIFNSTDPPDNDLRIGRYDKQVGAFDFLDDTAALPAMTDGLLHHIRMQLTEDGADVDYVVYLDGVSVLSGTRTALTIASATSLEFQYPIAGGGQSMALGHVTVWDGSVPSIADTVLAATAYIGEAAGRRFERLCELADVPFVSIGNLDQTLAMGAQFTDYFENQIAEIETTDSGLIYEPRDSLALGYRTRESLYDQEPTATLDYSNHELAPPFEPVEDDAHIANDVFAQRRDGGSRQATLESGALSVQDPPNGVGRYKDEVTVNVETDEMLEGMAAWLLVLGTVDEARLPRLHVDLANPEVVAAGIERQVLSIDAGDRVAVTDAAAAFIYDDISVLALGSVETLNAFEHRLTFNCTPASPYAVSSYESGDQARYDTTGSALNSSVTSSATTLSVKTTGTAGQTTLWTTAGDDFDIMVGGERMTCTAISGATSPQSFTVVRSVNGVVKAHAADTDVRLFHTPRYALGGS